MDINSLLSPSDSPAGTPVPQSQPVLPSPSMLQSPSKRAIRQMPSRTPSGLSQQVTSSPQPHAILQQLPSPGFAHIANGARAVHSAASTPQPMGSPHDARITPPHPLFRQGSTPGMDTLAVKSDRTPRTRYCPVDTLRDQAVSSRLEDLVQWEANDKLTIA
ncbi:Splicing factor [Neocucurbitaria cava]|uniref:Splicing factor n=1 Tax=Neocucurbitaria cava TaxID=798079 RepID=A0A9W9CH39_9PLEO|nr:Splicing factor [Neocucurbitaria cava]